MSLNKAIEHRKEKRKQYRGVKLYICSCRNHGTCEWCLQNRTYRTIRLKVKTDDELKDEYLLD